MFTALFITRYFFAGWVKNPQNKKPQPCRMDTTVPRIDFLGKAKPVILISLVVTLIRRHAAIQ